MIDLAAALGCEPEVAPRSEYSAQKSPLRSITDRNPAITAPVVSSFASCA